MLFISSAAEWRGIAGNAALLLVLSLFAPEVSGAMAVQGLPLGGQRPGLRDATITGVVSDSVGNPVSAVRIAVAGMNRTAISDDKGRFFIRALPPGTYHLDLVRIGYNGEHVVVVIGPDDTQIELDVVMRVATIRLSSVHVTSSPTGADPLTSSQAVVQLSGKELQRAVSTSVGQTLAGEPGMAVGYNGPMAAAPVIRGLSGERILVLQDGERTGDLSSSAADHLNAIDPNNAERIEVIRGPASLLYGNNALGGVINVITNDILTDVPSSFNGFLSGQGESVTPGGVLAGGVAIPLGSSVAFSARGGIRKFGELRQGGGVVQHGTDGSTSNATAGIGITHRRGTIGMGVRYMGFEYGLPHAEGDEAIRLDGARQQFVLTSTLATGSTAFSTLKLNGTAQRYSHDEIEEDGEIGTTFVLNSWNGDASVRTQFGRVQGSLGVQGMRRSYLPEGEEAFTPQANNANMALFVFQDIPLTSAAVDKSPRLQLGARIDRWTVETSVSDAESIERFGESQLRVFNNFAGSAGLTVPLTEGVSGGVNVSRGFRAPTVEELFANGFHAALGTFDIGNPDLRAEQSMGFDAGIDVQQGRTSAHVGAYINRVSDYIRPVAVAGTIEEEGPVVTFEQSAATLTGAELQVETRLAKGLIGGLVSDYLRARQEDGTPLPYIPAARVGASLRFDNGHFSVGGDVRHALNQTDVSGDALDVPTDGYTLVNMSAGWIFTARSRSVHSLTFRIDNVLDTEYHDAASRIKSFAGNPGRNISLVYRLLFQ